MGGCDSLVIQRYKLSSADTVLRDSFICNSLNVNTLTYRYKNISGCDSINIVTLKLLKKDTTVLPILSRCNPSDTVTKVLTLKNVGGCDSLVIQRYKLSSADTVLRDSFICNSLNVNTLTYKAKNISGCDSINIVTLKLLKKDTTVLPILSRCNPSDTVTKITKLINYVGCDSLVIQRYKLSSADTVLRDSLICNSLNVNTLTYKAKNISGCDSINIVTLKLLKKDTTVLPILTLCNPSDTATKVLTLKNLGGCDSLIIQRYKLSSADTVRKDSTINFPLPTGENIITRSYKNRFGCDSVEIITLKVSRCNDTTVLTAQFRCNTRDTMQQIQRLKNVFGCDSIVIQPFILGVKDTTVVNLTSCNPLDVGIKLVLLSNRFGCDSIIIRRTTLIPSGIITQLSVDKSLVCFGDSNGIISIKPPTGGQSPYQISWNNGANAEIIKGLKAGTYLVSVKDARGCVERDSILLASPPPLSITTQIKAPRCFEESNGSFILTDIKNGTAPFHFLYNGKDITLGNLPYAVSNLKAQDYSFSISDTKGCRASITLNLPQPKQLTLHFVDNTLLLQLGDSIQLSPQLNFTPHSKKWIPNSYLSCDTCLNPVTIPKSSILYKLEALNENGCSVVDSIQVQLSRVRNIFVPNTFSPNGDTENDYFTIFSDETVERVKLLEIYDRWGGKIYQNRDFLPGIENLGWDGTMNGKNADAGMYIYYYILIFKDGKEVILTGEVSLVR